jgi:SPX domain protein involved in polyphosphate accumulation
MLDNDIDLSPFHKSVTYWVHYHNQIETELFLLKHLTLQIPPYRRKKIQRAARAAYLDNETLEVYHSLVSDETDRVVEATAPHIIWEDLGTTSENAIIVVPSQSGEPTTLRTKTRNLREFLRRQEIPTTDSVQWNAISKQIKQSSYRPGTALPRHPNTSAANILRPDRIH